MSIRERLLRLDNRVVPATNQALSRSWPLLYLVAFLMLVVAVVAAFTGKSVGGVLWTGVVAFMAFWTAQTMRRNRRGAVDASGTRG